MKPGAWLMATAGEDCRRPTPTNEAIRLGRMLAGPAEARAEFEKAAALAGNARERKLLVQRAMECGSSDRRVDRSALLRQPKLDAPKDWRGDEKKPA